MTIFVRQIDGQAIGPDSAVATGTSNGGFHPSLVVCGIGSVLFLIASTIVLSLIPLYTSLRTATPGTCKSIPFDSTFNLNNGSLPNGQLSVNNQAALQTALNQYLTAQADFKQCSIQLQNANVANCSTNGRRQRRRRMQDFLTINRFTRQTNSFCKSQQITTTSTLNCNCQCNNRCLRQRSNQLQTSLLAATIPVTFVEPSNSLIILTGPNVPIRTTVDSTTSNSQSDDCYSKVSGVYLRSYTDGGSASQVSYALILFFPLGGLVQIDSAEKINTSNYYSDSAGYYQCETSSQSNTTKLSFSGVFFGQSGKKNVNGVRSTIACNSVSDDCSDRVIQCANGQLQSQAYELTLPDQQTGQFPNSISNTQQSRQFESQRIYTHPTITTNDRDKCYDNMSGVYITRYSDNTYDITVLSPLGYLFTVYPAGGISGDTFQKSTSVGLWYCSNSRSVSGLYTYFTYSNMTTSQSMVSGTYYMQCLSSNYDNCSGIDTKIYYPLQYQRMPFRDGQLNSSSTSTYTASRLYSAPTPASCHQKFSGIYAFEITIASLNTTYINTYILFRNAIHFSTGTYETDSIRPHSNMLGTWNCDLDGNITANRAYFVYRTATSSSTTVIVVSYVQFKCNDDATQCDGAFFSSTTSQLELPINGIFPSAQSSVNGTITGRRLQTNV